MNITIIGTGYLGLVTEACPADLGNHVIFDGRNLFEPRDIRNQGIEYHGGDQVIVGTKLQGLKQ